MSSVDLGSVGEFQILQPGLNVVYLYLVGERRESSTVLGATVKFCHR